MEERGLDSDVIPSAGQFPVMALCHCADKIVGRLVTVCSADSVTLSSRNNNNMQVRTQRQGLSHQYDSSFLTKVTVYIYFSYNISPLQNYVEYSIAKLSQSMSMTDF